MAARRPPGGASTFDLFSWSDGPPSHPPPPPTTTTTTSAEDAGVIASDLLRVSLSSSDHQSIASFVHPVGDDLSASCSPVGRPTIRMHQPAGGLSTISFGEHLTPEEADAALRSIRRPGSDTKRREMTGSGIFGAESEIDGIDSLNGVVPTPDRPSVRVNQPAGGLSQISFGEDGSLSPKKPTSLPEVAKQRELSGSQETIADIHVRRQFSNAKSKELVGSDIFGPPPEVPARSSNRTLEAREEVRDVKEPVEPAPRNVRTSVKVSNPAGGRSQITFGQDTTETMARKVHNQKVAELTGNNIFTGHSPPSSTSEKPMSVAKLREMSGNDIFADEKPVGRDCLGGIKKPPGGESSLSLV